jgi:hypothetical protein
MTETEDVAVVLNDVVDSKEREREPELLAEEAEVNGQVNGTGGHTESRKRVKESEPELEKAAGDAVLTEQEAAVYDRQIRVWGVEAQRRSVLTF